jgi:hypothetical protein
LYVINARLKILSNKEFLKADSSFSLSQSGMKKLILEMPVEDLVRQHPEAVGFLTRRGVRCIRCGEPLWCSLGDLFQADKVADPEALLAELNEYLARTQIEGGG